MPKRARITREKSRKSTLRLTSKSKAKKGGAKASPKKKGAKLSPANWDRWSGPSGKNGRRVPLGAHPKNTGGKKGRSGRKPDAFKEMCRQLASSDEVANAARSVLRNGNHPAFVGALRWASENGYGKPPQAITTTRRTETPGRIPKEDVKSELAKLFGDETPNEESSDG